MTLPRHSYLYFALALLVPLLLCSCRSTEKYAYISDAQRDEAAAILTNYSALAMPGDELEINIVSLSPESLYQFYERVNAGNPSDQEAVKLRQSYLVSKKGEIELPLIGKMVVAGKPLDTIATDITTLLRINNYVKDPIVSVTRTNFRVTVTGEVANPIMLHIQGNRLTIFEALAQTGDITLYGQRNNVKVMREENGEQVIGEIDLMTKDVLDSPYYYLQQNDIVYVEPNGQKKRTATTNPNISSYISMGLSVIRMISTVFINDAYIKYYQK